MGFDDYIKDRQAEETAEGTEETTVETAEQTEEQTTEETAQTEEQTPEIEQTTTEESSVIELEDEQLNTFFETTGKTKDEIKSAYTLGGKYSELEGKHNETLQELESLKTSNKTLKDELNPLSHFSSEASYIAEQLRKKYPTMDAGAIQKAIAGDVTQMSDLDVLALHDVIKRPGAVGGEAMAKKIIADEYSVDLTEPVSEWDELSRAKIQRAAYDARTEISKFKTEVELPAIKSEEALTAERAKSAEDLKTKWAPVIPKLTAFDKITIPGQEEGQEAFEFEVPQSFRDDLGESMGSIIEAAQLEPNEESVKFLMTERNKNFIYQNLGKILQSHEADLISKIQKQTDEELNNTTPPNTQTAPTGDGSDVGGTEKFIGGHRGRIQK